MDPQNVGMRDLAREQQFPLESLFEVSARRRIAENLGADDLESDGNIQLDVPRPIHDTHPANAELPFDPVARRKELPDVQALRS